MCSGCVSPLDVKKNAFSCVMLFDYFCLKNTLFSLNFTLKIRGIFRKIHPKFVVGQSKKLHRSERN